MIDSIVVCENNTTETKKNKLISIRKIILIREWKIWYDIT